MNFLLLLLPLFVSISDSLKILINSPRIGTSHVMFLGNIADILHLDGHEVTLFSSASTNFEVSKIGPKQKGVKIIEYTTPYMDKIERSINDMFIDGTWFNTPEEGPTINLEDMENLYEFQIYLMQGIYEDKNLTARLRAENFDVFITEAYELSSVAFQKHLGIEKAIYASAVGFSDTVYLLSGIPYPSYVPTWILSYDDEPTLQQRIKRVQSDFETTKILEKSTREQEELFAHFHGYTIDLVEVARKSVGALFVNSNLFTETPRPTSQIVKYIGGATIYNTTKARNQELDDLLNLRSLNVFFSLGSLVKLGDMPHEMQTAIAEAFMEFPDVTFLTRYDDVADEKHIFDKIPNVVLKKWWPQQKLLRDDRISLFITHAGLNSVIETVIHGMPTISLPIFCDQILNAKTLRNQNLTIHIPRNEITKETIVEALRKALHPRSELRLQAKKAEQILEGHPEQAREEIRKWTRIVGEYGQLHQFVLKGREKSLVEQYNLDIYAGLISISFSLLLVIIYSLRILLRRTLITFKTKKD